MNMDDPDAASVQNRGVSPPLQDQAKQDLGQATDKAMHDLDAVKQKAAEDVRGLQHEASAKVGEATEKAKSFAAGQKDLAAGQINGVAAAIGKVADELDGSDQQMVGRYARDLATGLSSLGETIKDRDIDDLMGMAQDYGRQQPMAFLGAAALAGFVASRFALASTHRRENKPASGTSGGDRSSSDHSSDRSPAQPFGQPGNTASGGQ